MIGQRFLGASRTQEGHCRMTQVIIEESCTLTAGLTYTLPVAKVAASWSFFLRGI